MKFTSSNFFITLFILILFSSCKKDDSVNLPNVIFVSSWYGRWTPSDGCRTLTEVDKFGDELSQRKANGGP